MDQQSPYPNPELDLANLVKAISLSTHQLSGLLNGGLEKNFYDFINLYRVEVLKHKQFNYIYTELSG